MTLQTPRMSASTSNTNVPPSPASALSFLLWIKNNFLSTLAFKTFYFLSLSFSLSMNYEQKPCRALLVCLSLTNTNKRKLARKNVRPYLETVYSRLCKCLQFHPTSSTEIYWVIVHWAEKLPASSASKSDSLYRCGNVGGWYVSLGEGNTLNISDKKIPATVTDVTLVANRDSGW